MASSTSTATIRFAYARRAPWMAASPTPPQPITATVAPAGTCAVLRTAPTPVKTPQPSRQARESGRAGSIFTTLFWLTSMYSAKLPSATNWWTGPLVVAQSRRCVRPPGVVVGEAPVRLPGHAVRTVPAEHRQARDDVVAGLEVAHPGADGLDDSGGFVAEDERDGEGHAVAGQCVHVAVADPRCHDPQEDLADPGRVDLHILDRRRSRHRLDHCGAHAGSMPRRSDGCACHAGARTATPRQKVGATAVSVRRLVRRPDSMERIGPCSSTLKPSETLAARSPPLTYQSTCAAWMTPPEAAAIIVGTRASLGSPSRSPRNSAMTRWIFSWMPTEDGVQHRRAGDDDGDPASHEFGVLRRELFGERQAK